MEVWVVNETNPYNSNDLIDRCLYQSLHSTPDVMVDFMDYQKKL